MTTILFITDGGPQLGMGHVQQSLALAQALRSGTDVRFLTKSDVGVVAKIRNGGFDVAQARNDAELFRALKAADPDIVIFDKLDVAEDFARDIKNNLRARLVIFTNLSDANRYADVAVTADIGSRFQNIRFTDQRTKTIYFYGPKYWVLRQEFYEYKRHQKPVREVVERILLTFGGSDPVDATSAVLSQLLRRDDSLRIDVILGSHYGHDDAFARVLGQHPEKKGWVTVHRNIANVAELMFAADLVLASPGLSAFEALCVGTPVIVVPQNMLQRDTYKGFMCMIERDGLEVLGTMIGRRQFTFPCDKRITAMEIGEGVEELNQVIMCQGTESV